VRKKLSKISFVDTARLSKGVSFDTVNQIAYLAVKKGKPINVKEMKKAIDDAGFDPVHYYQLKAGKLVTFKFGK